eukprot:CAMPEP_0182890712 /NCGR_PEP_ID=MMETSP0034_2-20130328/22829_1 /TAXON_ID=156128 /ORGANISM="Nephroselmis pyriformis, Strain CCMP717" /LENGTH=319 /DNA_ID=CAMNT_0025024285 /DNA_START=32 /DNA_END=988 /DNA_ORIENTATION=+
MAQRALVIALLALASLAPPAACKKTHHHHHKGKPAPKIETCDAAISDDFALWSTFKDWEGSTHMEHVPSLSKLRPINIDMPRRAAGAVYVAHDVEDLRRVEGVASYLSFHEPQLLISVFVEHAVWRTWRHRRAEGLPEGSRLPSPFTDVVYFEDVEYLPTKVPDETEAAAARKQGRHVYSHHSLRMARAIVAAMHSPYERTIVMQAGVCFCGAYTGRMLEALEVNDIATLLHQPGAPGRAGASGFASHMRCQKLHAAVPATFPERSTAFMMFRRNNRTSTLLQRWFDIFGGHITSDLSDCVTNEQAALREAIFQLGTNE